jgi:cobalt/nickel transport system permease protein
MGDKDNWLSEVLVLTHIELPDGILPGLWVVAGLALTLGLAWLASRRVSADEARRMLPRLAVSGALMLLAMSVPLGIIPAHANVSALVGILIGPWFGFIAALVANLILALVGHGGITVVGLNTLVVGLEVALGWAFFSHLRRRLPVAAAAGASTALALSLSFVVVLTFLGSLGADPASILIEEGASEAARFGLQAPLAFLLTVFGIGTVIDTLLAGLAVGYIARVRPDLLDSK